MRFVAFGVLWTLLSGPPAPSGILLLAHGGSERWNENVRSVAASIDSTLPTEIAFGMATRSAIQDAVDRLQARGVSRIVAVPLFISSHSSIVTSTEYLLGLRKQMRADLKIFAKMSHGNHSGASSADATTPVNTTVPSP